MKEITVTDKSRRMAIAVANWLCGTLEGITCDNSDIELSKELDSWLQKQKNNYQILYTGSVVCESCKKSWECQLLSNAINSVQCPHCGTVQKRSLSLQSHTKPENDKALRKIQNETTVIISKISKLNQTIKNQSETIDNL